MARGWESKGVEEQQSQAPVRHAKEEKRPAAEIARDNKRRSLELLVIRVERQIANASSERHREMLGRALDELKTRISNL